MDGRRLLLFLLMGTILLAAGCARQQAPHPEADQPHLFKHKDAVSAARSAIGIPYRYGGTSPATGFDCSGLVCWAYQHEGIRLPRSARDQLTFGTKVERREDLKPGDIVIFKGTRGRSGWHSGIYTGNGRFVHSPHTGKTVTENRLDETYYASRFAGARRIPRDGSASHMYAQYEARQRASAQAAKEAKQSRKQADAKTGTQAKASAGKPAGKKQAASSSKTTQSGTSKAPANTPSNARATLP